MMVLVVTLTRVLSFLPMAVLAAIVIASTKQLVSFKDAKDLWKSKPSDFAQLAITFVAVIACDVMYGLIIGIAFSLMLVLYRSFRPRLVELGRLPGSDVFVALNRFAESRRVPGVVLLRLDGELHFGNVRVVTEKLLGLLQGAKQASHKRQMRAVTLSMEDGTGDTTTRAGGAATSVPAVGVAAVNCCCGGGAGADGAAEEDEGGPDGVVTSSAASRPAAAAATRATQLRKEDGMDGATGDADSSAAIGTTPSASSLAYLPAGAVAAVAVEQIPSPRPDSTNGSDDDGGGGGGRSPAVDQPARQPPAIAAALAGVPAANAVSEQGATGGSAMVNRKPCSRVVYALSIASHDPCEQVRSRRQQQQQLLLQRQTSEQQQHQMLLSGEGGGGGLIPQPTPLLSGSNGAAAVDDVVFRLESAAVATASSVGDQQRQQQQSLQATLSPRDEAGAGTLSVGSSLLPHPSPAASSSSSFQLDDTQLQQVDQPLRAVILDGARVVDIDSTACRELQTVMETYAKVCRCDRPIDVLHWLLVARFIVLFRNLSTQNSAACGPFICDTFHPSDVKPHPRTGLYPQASLAPRVHLLFTSLPGPVRDTLDAFGMDKATGELSLPPAVHRVHRVRCCCSGFHSHLGGRSLTRPIVSCLFFLM